MLNDKDTIIAELFNETGIHENTLKKYVKELMYYILV
jgi:hypothetical protein